jgi:hypothetical protein
LQSCYFPDCGRSILQALYRNSALETLFLCVDGELDESGCDALASLLLVNTTLTDLTVCASHTFPLEWLQPFFVALRIITSLKKLHVDSFSLSVEPLCGALRDVFAKNTVLEVLTLRCDSSPGDTDVVAWRNTLPFLRDNKTLKSLTINADYGSKHSHLSAFCIDTAAILKDNNSLEILNIDDYFTAIESLQTNTTLKTLRLHPKLDTISDDGTIQHFISLVKKNYGLESLDEGLIAHDTTGELGTILRLNQADVTT